jgi:hypothetical protein
MKHAPESYFQEDAVKVEASISGERKREAEAWLYSLERACDWPKSAAVFPPFIPHAKTGPVRKEASRLA